MKIALVHYRYFQGDGPERYLFNIKEILEKNGHITAPFSIRNSRNEPSGYAKYFLDDIDDEVYYGENRMTPAKAVKMFSRMYWSPEARRKFSLFLDDVAPDIVYMLQYHNKISPSIIGAARKRGIPVVHRISDFQYMCPGALFYGDGHVCEDCLHGHPLSCIRRRCVHGSAMLSALKLGAKKFHDVIGVTRKIDAFVVPSAFTLGKLREYGIDDSRLHHIPTFYNKAAADSAENTFEPFFLYVGRISEQKGIRTLVNAFAGTGVNLKIVGTSADNLEQRLKDEIAGKSHRIEFLGYKPFHEIEPLLRSCMATIMPAEGYDNFPNAVLESFGFGKPVIASALGSLLETVVDGVTGITFPAGNADALAGAVRRLLDNPDEARRMGAEARRRVLSDYSPERHYKTLVTLFDALVSRRRLAGKSDRYSLQ